MSLYDQVKRVAAFADENSPQAHWGHVVFHGGELWAQSFRGGALLKTPDLDISIAVPAKKLLKALQAVDRPELRVEDNFRLKMIGEGATAHIEGVRVKDVPSLHRPSAAEEWLFVPGLSRVADFDWCISQDLTRRHLTGFHFNPDGHVEATDGHALMCLDLGVKGLPNMLVPMPVLRGLEGDQWIAKHGGRVFVAAEKGGASGFGVGSLIEAEFPPVDRFIANARDQGKMKINRLALLAMCKKAKLSNVEACLSVEKGRLAAEVDGKRQASLFGFASSVPYESVSGEKEVPDGKIGFSLALLIPMFESATSDEVVLYLTPTEDGGLNPLMLIDGPYVGIAMPYRL